MSFLDNQNYTYFSLNQQKYNVFLGMLQILVISLVHFHEIKKRQKLLANNLRKVQE